MPLSTAPLLTSSAWTPRCGNERRARHERLQRPHARPGRTQEELAEHANLDYKHYQEIERGAKQEVRFSTLSKIADAFRLPIYELFMTDDPASVIAETRKSYKAVKKTKKNP